jgi:DNA-binding GntR family transcriptional regulator
MKQGVVPSLYRESLPEKIAASLRDAFIADTLSPGSRLIEVELARQLGVSRTALREALRMLQSEGLIETRPNRGTFVAQISEQDIDEIYSLRSLLETYAVQLVAERSTPQEVEVLQAIVDRMNEATVAREMRRAADIDLELHNTIWEISGHQRLCQFLSSIRSQIRMFFTVNTNLYESLVASAVSDHQEIVKAIRAHDGAAAAELMKGHLESAQRQTRDFFRRQAIAEGRAHAPTEARPAPALPLVKSLRST